MNLSAEKLLANFLNSPTNLKDLSSCAPTADPFNNRQQEHGFVMAARGENAAAQRGPDAAAVLDNSNWRHQLDKDGLALQLDKDGLSPKSPAGAYQLGSPAEAMGTTTNGIAPPPTAYQYGKEQATPQPFQPAAAGFPTPTKFPPRPLLGQQQPFPFLDHQRAPPLHLPAPSLPTPSLQYPADERSDVLWAARLADKKDIRAPQQRSRRTSSAGRNSWERIAGSNSSSRTRGTLRSGSNSSSNGKRGNAFAAAAGASETQQGALQQRRCSNGGGVSYLGRPNVAQLQGGQQQYRQNFHRQQRQQLHPSSQIYNSNYYHNNNNNNNLATNASFGFHLDNNTAAYNNNPIRFGAHHARIMMEQYESIRGVENNNNVSAAYRDCNIKFCNPLQYHYGGDDNRVIPSSAYSRNGSIFHHNSNVGFQQRRVVGGDATGYASRHYHTSGCVDVGGYIGFSVEIFDCICRT